jgi:hypothetical protein
MKKEAKKIAQLPPRVLKQMADQIAAALKDYRERRAKDPKTNKPEYLVTGDLKLYVDGLLVICGELDAMVGEQQKEFGIRAADVSRALADKLVDEVTSGLAQAYSRMCLPVMESYPEPTEPEVAEEEETEEEEPNE